MKLKTLCIVLALVAVSFSMANASGIPAAGIMNDPDFPVIVVMKFGAGFTAQDAQNSAQLISQAIGLAGQLTTAAQSVLFYSPANLAQLGVTDADVLKTALKGPAAQLGFTYLFLDMSKKASVEAQYGQNIKVDIWVANDGPAAQLTSGLGVTGAYIYIATIEFPENFPQVLARMLSSL